MTSFNDKSLEERIAEIDFRAWTPPTLKRHILIIIADLKAEVDGEINRIEADKKKYEISGFGEGKLEARKQFRGKLGA